MVAKITVTEGEFAGWRTYDLHGAFDQVVGLEFRRRDSYPLLTDMVGGASFGLQPGQWTDDTTMALALSESLSVRGSLNEQDLLARFIEWWRKGTYS